MYLTYWKCANIWNVWKRSYCMILREHIFPNCMHLMCWPRSQCAGMRSDSRTRVYVERRTKEGMSHKEIHRCLKRYLVRELYPLILADLNDSMRSTWHRSVNPVVESFFGSLKQERVQWRYYQTRHEAHQDVLNYITIFYNNHRLHSYLGYRSPNQYEAEMGNLKNVA